MSIIQNLCIICLLTTRYASTVSSPMITTYGSNLWFSVTTSLTSVQPCTIFKRCWLNPHKVSNRSYTNAIKLGDSVKCDHWLSQSPIYKTSGRDPCTPGYTHTWDHKFKGIVGITYPNFRYLNKSIDKIHLTKLPPYWLTGSQVWLYKLPTLSVSWLFLPCVWQPWRLGYNLMTR